MNDQQDSSAPHEPTPGLGAELFRALTGALPGTNDDIVMPHAITDSVYAGLVRLFADGGELLKGVTLELTQQLGVAVGNVEEDSPVRRAMAPGATFGIDHIDSRHACLTSKITNTIGRIPLPPEAVRSMFTLRATRGFMNTLNAQEEMAKRSRSEAVDALASLYRNSPRRYSVGDKVHLRKEFLGSFDADEVFVVTDRVLTPSGEGKFAWEVGAGEGAALRGNRFDIVVAGLTEDGSFFSMLADSRHFRPAEGG